MRWIQDPETLELIPADQYRPPKEREVNLTIIPDIEPYTSPVDGRVINSRRQRADDLKRTQSRPWEGREVEEREARRHIAESEERIANRMVESFIDRVRHSSSEIRRALDI